MRRNSSRLAMLALALLVLGCASAQELTRRSEQAVRAHDYERAYKDARAALDKEPENGRARLALSAAAHPMIERRKQRITNLAATDTTQAADEVLSLAEFTGEVERYGAPLAQDPAFARSAEAIRIGAAAQRYREGRALEKEKRSRPAYRSYLAASRYEPGHADLEQRMLRVHELAMVRVAVLPFDDGIEARGVTMDLTEHMHAELASAAQGMEFVRLIDLDRVRARWDAGRSGSAEQAIAAGRALGANVVVRGAYVGLRSDSRSDRYRGSIYEQVTERDTAGRNVTRWVDVPFVAIERERDVSVRWSYDMISVDDEDVLLRDEDEVHRTAATFFTDFQAAGDVARYALYPPTWKRSHADHCASLDDGWSQTFGRWTVPELLRHTREVRGTRGPRRSIRQDFARARDGYPIYHDGLPSAEDMAYVALADVWQDVLEGLRKLEEL